MRKCKECGQGKEIVDFYKNKLMSDGYDTKCKECKKAYARKRSVTNKQQISEKNKQHRSKNRDKINAQKKVFYEQNKEQILAQQKIYCEENKEEIANRKKEYREKNKDRLVAASKRYVEKNKDKIRAYKRQWFLDNKEQVNKTTRIRSKERRKTDINYKIKQNLRGRVYKAMKGLTKYDNTLNLVGCSVESLKTHLESQFQPEMSWANYGEWHIDHIKPCVLFNLENEDEQKKCFHFMNLQPLWAEDNLKKGCNA